MLAVLSIWWCLLGLVSAELMKMDPTDHIMTACFNAAGNLYAFGEYCPDADYSIQTSTNRCPCNDTRFAETVVNCISRLAANESNNSVARNNSLEALSTKCSQLTLPVLVPYLLNTSLLKSYDGNRSGLASTWPVTNAFALPDKEIRDSYIVAIKSDSREENNKRYGAALVVYWAGIFIMQILGRAFISIFPQFTQIVYRLPWIKLWRQKVSVSPSKLSSVTNLQIAIISVYVVLAAVFSFIQLGVWFPDNTVYNRNSGSYGRALGMRTGVLSLYMMPLLILFAGRNNFLLWLTGWSQDTFVLFHRWVARVEVMLLLAHAIGYSISRAARMVYKSMWGQGYWSWGIVGFAFAMFMLIQGMKFMRSYAYDLFVALHIVAAVLFLVGGYYHLLLLEEPLAYNFFYASFAVWGFDRAFRLARVVLSGFAGRQNSVKGTLESFGVPALIQLEHNTLVITFDCPLHWSVLGYPGQIVYLHFLTGWHFWQSHPFTLVVSSSEPGKLKVFARIHRGITKQLADLVSAQGQLREEPQIKNEACQELEVRLLLDGPYGHSHDLFEYDELIMVAGGTGITAPFAYIQNSIFRFPNGYQKIKLFWAVSTSLEKWFDEELRFLQDYKHVEISLFHTRDTEFPQKFSIPESVGKALSQTSGPTAVLCCGPESMNQMVRHTVANHITSSPHMLQYYEESFSL